MLRSGEHGCCERLRETDANAVGPDDMVKLLLVEGSLRGQLREVDVGSELGGVEIDFEGAKHAFVFVENVVSRIAREVCAEAGETNMLIFGRNKIGDRDAREVRLAEAVFDEEEILLLAPSMNRWN